MKNKYSRILSMLLPAIVIAGILNSCNDNDIGGTPTISYVRITDPVKSDSAMISANMGQLIAIIGKNLGGLKECYFNDLKATLNPAYITDKSILVNVPNALPSKITNLITMHFSDGYELRYDFTVDVALPVVTGTKCEFVPDGDNMVIYGDYFFAPLEVIFPGGEKGEVVRVDKQEIEVTVPKGAKSGQILVQNSVGTAKSQFLFRDDRNIIVNFDTKLHETWTASIVPSDSLYEIEGCSGSFVLLKSSAANSWLNELFVYYEGTLPLFTGANPDLDFCFELNVPIPWQDIQMEIFFAPKGEGHGRDLKDNEDNYITSFYRWMPWLNEPYTTDGWITVKIPLSDFNYAHNEYPTEVTLAEGTNPLGNISGFTNFSILIFEGQQDKANSFPIEMGIDNIRIVPHSVY